MPAAEQEIGLSAGISPQEEVDVEELAARLREEVKLAATGRGGRGAARAAAERLWPVTADRPVGGGLRGLVKRALRKLMRWYVEPLAADQRGFNDAALKLLDDLSERLDRERAGREAAERLGRELKERLTRLERRGRAAPATVAPQPAAAAMPDYFAFEARMRGATDDVRGRQRPYLGLFRDAAPVLDVGCGRGEFLALLRESGVEARGVDADGDMVAYARGEGLDVVQADALAYVRETAPGSLGAVFMAQVVEHLPPAALVALLEPAAAALRPGGLLVAETINPLSPLALRNYFADLTHAQPLVPETLELLARQCGFSQVETRYLNEPDRRLEEPDDAVLAANARRLNEILFAPLDYAVVARTPGA